MRALLKAVFSHSALILLGALLSLIAIETGLNVCASIRAFQFSRQLSQELANSGAIRILAIGESTTEGFGTDTWPSQLQRLLIQKYPDKTFQVVNRGITSSDSGTIAKSFPQWITKYQPQIVISMLGINDLPNRLVFSVPESRVLRNIQRLRTYRFIRGLWNSYQDQTVPKEQQKKGGAPVVRDCVVLTGEVAVSVLEDMAANCMNLRDFNSALLILRDLNRRIPSVKYLNQLSEIESRPDGNFLNAIHHNEQIVSIDSSNFQAHVKLSRLWHNRDRKMALVHTRNAVLLAPNNREVLNEVFMKIRDYKLEPVEFDGFIEQFSEREAWRYVLRAELRRFRGQTERFIEDLELAADFDPPDQGAIEMLYKHLKDRGDANPQRYFLKAYQSGTRSERFLDSFSRALFEQNRYNESLEIMMEKGLIGRASGASLPYDSLRQEAGSQLLKYFLGQDSREVPQQVAAFLNATKLHIENISSATRVNYQEIKNITFKSGALLVAMQYPLLDAAVLKDVLNNDPRVIFVSNNKNFSDALVNKSYTDVFTDRFGGVFGHLTDFGNSLLAESAAKAVEPLITKQ